MRLAAPVGQPQNRRAYNRQPADRQGAGRGERCDRTGPRRSGGRTQPASPGGRRRRSGRWRRGRPGRRERVLAGRLAMALGRRGSASRSTCARIASSPGDPEALYYRARAILALRGPFAAWRFMRTAELPAIRAARGARRLVRARRRRSPPAFGTSRPPSAARPRPQALCPDRPWIAVEHTAVLEEQDRLEDALARISGTLRASPLFRPGSAPRRACSSGSAASRKRWRS